MFNRKLISLFLGLMMTIGLSAAAHAQQGEEGGTNFLFINYIGQEMSFDLDDVTYTIPGTNLMPDGGQLALTLPFGEHKYAANVPGVKGYAAEFTLEPGQQVGLGARIEQTAPRIEEGILLEKPQDYVAVFSFDPQAAGAEPVLIKDTWQPGVAAAGMQSLVWVNYVGDELTIDLDGQIYTVPPVADGIPGRLQQDLAPGEYTYSATVPYGGLNGEFTAQAGQVTSFTISADPPPEREYEIGEEFELILPVALKLFVEDLTTQAATAAVPDASVTPVSVPLSLPDSGGLAETPTMPEPEVVPLDGLQVSNYAGDTLTFTINDQTFMVASNETNLLDIPPGSYTFSASTPFVSTTGTVDVDPVTGATVSIVLDVAGNFLAVYQ